MNYLAGISVLLASATVSSACMRSQGQKNTRHSPNILLLLADDMGYSDLHCYGGPSFTPNLDKLAEEGIRFTNFYAAAPNCSPSRAGLLTGRSPARSGIYNYRPAGSVMHLRNSEITIAEMLKQKGYQTVHLGKWHLGCLPRDTSLDQPQPSDQGFDYSFGTESNAIPSHLNPVNFVRNGKKTGVMKGYSCQIVADEFINWIGNNHKTDQPFFAYVAFHEPHHKIASPPALVRKYGNYPKSDAEYLANIENLDSAAGRIINYLGDEQLLDNTLVIFASDNGSYRQASNKPLRAVKSYLYDGGIRVPGIIRWPRKIMKDTILNEPAGFVDIFPTICDILDIPLPEDRSIDGTSILSLLQGKPFKRTEPLFWFFYRTSPEIAIREGQYMILGMDHDSTPRTHNFSAPDMDYIKSMSLSDFQMYDLVADPGEKYNLFNQSDDKEQYKLMLNQQLEDIQDNGYTWDALKPASGPKKIKTDWVKYTF